MALPISHLLFWGTPIGMSPSRKILPPPGSRSSPCSECAHLDPTMWIIDTYLYCSAAAHLVKLCTLWAFVPCCCIDYSIHRTTEKIHRQLCYYYILLQNKAFLSKFPSFLLSPLIYNSQIKEKYVSVSVYVCPSSISVSLLKQPVLSLEH